MRHRVIFDPEIPVETPEQRERAFPELADFAHLKLGHVVACVPTDAEAFDRTDAIRAARGNPSALYVTLMDDVPCPVHGKD